MPTKDEFVIPAKDQKGHSERLWISIQPGHLREIQVILQGKRFPYRTSGDLVRHALLKHLHYLHGLLQSGEIQRSVLRQTDIIIDNLQHEQWMSDFSTVFNKISDRIGSYLKSDKDAAIRLVLEVRRDIMAMPDDFWRTRYMNELESLYGYLLKDAKKAGWADFSEESG